MLDYIYQGEVQIYQENLDRFLDIAKKFNLDGLVPPGKDNENFKEEQSFPSNENYEQNEEILPVLKPIKECSVDVLTPFFEAQNSDVNEKFEELVVNEDNFWKCTVCHKAMKEKRDMRRHLETHLNGLSFDCKYCGKMHRSSIALRDHIRRHHK